MIDDSQDKKDPTSGCQDVSCTGLFIEDIDKHQGPEDLPTEEIGGGDNDWDLVVNQIRHVWVSQ